MKLTTDIIRNLIREEIEGAAPPAEGQPASAETDMGKMGGASAADAASRLLQRVPKGISDNIRKLAVKNIRNQRAVMNLVLQQFAGLSAEQINALMKTGAKTAIK